jgi:hypothetical protein
MEIVLVVAQLSRILVICQETFPLGLPPAIRNVFSTSSSAIKRPGEPIAISGNCDLTG